ncbi:PiggyBac transposable element-derived protein 4 [Portunus trituberculatus]|uniref:PiggyBac transposable element-derived protein 4 n=1 Tax=Portunus trituberculatus TaxID=210409 RepID=A0A5B7JU38_PORTR|nr:PiggyBac transposable element-derived protein 4 [Portunus trituberculatus]
MMKVTRKQKGLKKKKKRLSGHKSPASSVAHLISALFFVDIMMLNAHILFKEKTCKNPTLQDFVIKVVRQLLEENAVEHPTPGCHVVDNPVRLTGQHFPCTLQPRPDMKKKKVQKACHVCSHTKRRPRKRSDTRYCCHECDVALCIEPCFAEYHTLL